MIEQLIHRIRSLALAMTVLLAAGCATLDPKNVQIQTKGKTVAVASALGPNLDLKWMGTTIFNWEEGQLAVPSWGIDEQATKAASAALSATQRYAAVTVLTGVRRAAIAGRVGDPAPKLPADARADFLLLISQSYTNDAIYRTNATYAGLGIAQRSLLGFEPPTHAYISVLVELFDITAGKSLGSRQKFVHWPITAKLKSGGSSTRTLNKNPVPSIDDRDLAQLQQPFTTRLVPVIDQLIGDIGLR